MTSVRLHLALWLLVCGVPAGPALAENGIVLIYPAQLGGEFDPRCATHDLDGNIVISGMVKSLVNSTWGYNFLTISVCPNGTLNPDFGNGGVVLTNVAVNLYDYALACMVQADGKLIAAGGANVSNKRGEDFALVRYRPDGSLDKTFNNKKGIVTTNFGANECIHDVGLQADGKILALGTGPGFLTARYTSSGHLDASFGQGGYVRTAVRIVLGGTCGTLRVFPDYFGGILAVGSAGLGSDGLAHIVLAYYTENGTPVESFGDGGTLVIAPGGPEVDTALKTAILDAQKRILIGGSWYRYDPDPVNQEFGWMIARLNSDCSLDGTFGEGKGYVRLAPLGWWESAAALALQSDGKIVAAGRNYHDDGANLVVARFNEDGSLDTDFGNNGCTEQPIAAGTNMDPMALLIEPDGKIVVVAPLYSPEPWSHDYGVALLRYLSDGTLDPDF